jgi:hypothetical protein
MIRPLPRIGAMLLAVATAACADSPTAPGAVVETVTAETPRAGDRGPVVRDAHSLQAALDEAAAGSGPATIVVQGRIVLEAPLAYTGDNDLTLLGRGAQIVGPFAAIDAPTPSAERVGEPTVGDALQIFGAPDLRIRDVRFRGQTGHGIYFEVPGEATGTVQIDFTGVRFRGQGLSGLWFEDQANAAGAIESDASVHLALQRVSVRGTGFADGPSEICGLNDEDLGCEWADFDGMRINEGGAGDITLAFRNVDFRGNAGDGIEFDETGAGSVGGRVVNGAFDGNGAQPQFPVDLEDGFDIDEAGEGGIALAMTRVGINRNVDEGLDLDEEGSGDVELTLVRVRALENQDDNVKVSEDADLEDVAEADLVEGTGGIVVAFTQLRASGSLDGDGVGLEGFGAGRVVGTIDRSRIRRNADDGLQAEQSTGGPGVDGELTIVRSRIRGNGDDDLNLENIVVS